MAALCWSSREEIPHDQGKRNPSKTVGVARGHQRANTVKPYSQKTSQSNHIRTTAAAESLQSCPTVPPHRRQPTRLPRPWDSPGKNTGVGCHFLLQCMKVKSESEFAQSCPTPSDPMDCSPPGSSVHGILQAKVLEWVAISFSKRSS